MNKLQNWLKYWKNTLADSDEKIIDIITEPIIVNRYYIDRVPIKFAVLLWKSAKPKDNGVLKRITKEGREAIKKTV